MIEIKFTKVVINERKELSCSFICKENDYTEVELEMLRQSKIKGDFLDIELTGLKVSDQTEERKKKLQTLGGLMELYAERSNTKLGELIQRLYSENKVDSRTQLNDSQLD